MKTTSAMQVVHTVNMSVKCEEKSNKKNRAKKK